MNKSIYLNWKCYLNSIQSIELVIKIKKHCLDFGFELPVIFPSTYLLKSVLNSYEAKNLGVQNIYFKELGAYTGETTLNIFSDFNIKYCLVGHSERRVYFNESNEDVLQKTMSLIKNDIIPIICVGENNDEYNLSKRDLILEEQLIKIKNSVDVKKIIVAYEPIWAISGFSVNAINKIKPEFNDIKNAILKIKELLGDEVQVLYGGSVDLNLDEEFFNNDLINGFLIGKSGTDFEIVKKLLQKSL